MVIPGVELIVKTPGKNNSDKVASEHQRGDVFGSELLRRRSFPSEENFDPTSFVIVTPLDKEESQKEGNMNSQQANGKRFAQED